MLGKINATATYFSWLVFAAFGVIFFLGLLDVRPHQTVVDALAIGFLSSAAIHAVLAFFVRCPYCNRCLTVQGFGKPHPDSIHRSWSAVTAAWCSGRVGCIHCGKTVSTNDL